MASPLSVREQGSASTPTQGDRPKPYPNAVQRPFVDSTLRKRQTRKQARPTSAAGEGIETLGPSPRIHLRLVRSGMSSSGGSDAVTTGHPTEAAAGGSITQPPQLLQGEGYHERNAGTVPGLDAARVPPVSMDGNADHPGTALQRSETTFKRELSGATDGLMGSFPAAPLQPPDGALPEACGRSVATAGGELTGDESRRRTRPVAGQQPPAGARTEYSRHRWAQWAVLLSTMRGWLSTRSTAQQLPPIVRDPEVNFRTLEGIP